MESIESPQNARIKAVAKLRQSRGRKQDQRFVIDGVRETLRALATGQAVETLIVCGEQLTESALSELLSAAEAHALVTGRPVEVWDTSPAAFEKVAYGQRDEGVVAVARSQPRRLADWKRPVASDIFVVLEGCEKPGNLGAIFRTADAMGAAGIVLIDAAVLPENPNAIRASLGTVFSVPWAVATLAEAQAWLQQHGVRGMAARVQASSEYWDVPFFAVDRPAQPLAIVLGSEADGLTAAWLGEPYVGVRIPQAGIADSLNLSVAAGVLLYEAARQRRRVRVPE